MVRITEESPSPNRPPAYPKFEMPQKPASKDDVAPLPVPSPLAEVIKESEELASFYGSLVDRINAVAGSLDNGPHEAPVAMAPITKTPGHALMATNATLRAMAQHIEAAIIRIEKAIHG